MAGVVGESWKDKLSELKWRFPRVIPRAWKLYTRDNVIGCVRACVRVSPKVPLELGTNQKAYCSRIYILVSWRLPY